MDPSSPARLYSLVFGAVLTIAGIIGFFYEAEFTTDEVVRDELFGLFAVNGWHNTVHIVTGVLGLLAAGGAAIYARAYALGLGLVYVIVAAWGFAIGSGDSILGIVPVNTEDNVLHLVIGVAGLAAGVASPEPGESRPPPPAQAS